jgi:hypothetical protein
MDDPHFTEEQVVEERTVRRARSDGRRVVTRRTAGGTGGIGPGFNPAVAVVAALLVAFILVLIFGYLL